MNRSGVRPLTRDYPPSLALGQAMEDWLRTRVTTAYDALQADGSQTVSLVQVRARLAAAHKKATGQD